MLTSPLSSGHNRQEHVYFFSRVSTSLKHGVTREWKTKRFGIKCIMWYYNAILERELASGKGHLNERPETWHLKYSIFPSRTPVTMLLSELRKCMSRHQSALRKHHRAPFCAQSSLCLLMLQPRQQSLDSQVLLVDFGQLPRRL
jgi:hypothetical protein